MGPKSPSFRLLEKPPRPRLSRSPALRAYDNRITDNSRLVTNESKGAMTSGQKWDDQKDLNSKSDVQEQDQATSQTCSSGDQSQVETSLEEPNMDLQNLVTWVKETSKTNPINDYSFSSTKIPQVGTYDIHGVRTSRLRLEDDILAQWRLRRKMEQAHLAVQPRIGVTNGWCESSFCRHKEVTNHYNKYELPSIYSPHSCSCKNCYQTTLSPVYSQRDQYSGSFCRDMGVQGSIRNTSDVMCQTEDSMDNIPSKLCSTKNASCMTEKVHPRFCEMHSKGVLSKITTRSVSCMVRPCSKSCSVQTTIDNSDNFSPNHPSTNGLSKKSPLYKSCSCSSAIGAPKEILETILGITHEPIRTDIGCSILDDGYDESARSTETDSWAWQSTPTTPQPTNMTNSSHPSQIMVSRDQLRQTKAQKCGTLKDQVEPGFQASGAAFHETITRYLEQSAQQLSTSQIWMKDPIVKDLLDRRDIRLMEMKSILQKIHEREVILLESARASELMTAKTKLDENQTCEK